MRFLIVFSMTLLASVFAFAAEEGRFYNCHSKNGSVRFIIGTTGEEPEATSTAELIIDGKSSGPMNIGTDIEGSSAGATTQFTMANNNTDWLTIEFQNTSDEDKKQGLLKMRILSGINPNTNTEIAAPINIICKFETTRP